MLRGLEPELPICEDILVGLVDAHRDLAKQAETLD